MRIAATQQIMDCFANVIYQNVLFARVIYKRRGNFSNKRGDKHTSRSPNDNIYANLFAFQFIAFITVLL